MTALWTAAEAAAATGGTARGTWFAHGISIDTRELEEGDLFVALKDVRDGHDFVADALRKGAAAAMVSRIPEGLGPDAPLLVVGDVLAALERLGQAGRARSRARVIAVTGSAGKTSTKEMLRAVLAGQGRVHAAEKSFNNHWGVPVTLARLPRAADFAVVEIGMNHPGEIAPLARLARPHVAMVTTIAAAHLAAFDDLDGIAREKVSICDGLEPGGIAVLNADVSTAATLAQGARAAGARVVTFGEAPDADARILRVTLNDGRTVVQARVGAEEFLFKLASPGRHFAANAAGVLAVVRALGLDLALAVGDLLRWQPQAGRGTLETRLLDPMAPRLCYRLIDDAFNANPASMCAALEVLATSRPVDGIGRVSRGRRIAILGDMLELGPNEAALHGAIAEMPGFPSVDTLHAVGPRMRALFDATPQHRRGEWHEKAEDLAARAHHLVDAGDVVLVKGSKGSKVSKVVDALRKLSHAPATDTEDQH